MPVNRSVPDVAQKGGPCYRGQARLSTTSQALRASSPSRGASGETVHFAETAKASPTRRGGIASAMTERLYEDRADGSRAVSTKKEDPLSELQLREGVFFLVSQMTSSISTFTIYSLCHSPQKSSAVQKVYSFAHPPGTSSLRASSRRAVPSGRSLAASIWPGETW